MSDATHASRTGLGKEKVLNEQTWNFLVMPQLPTINPLLVTLPLYRPVACDITIPRYAGQPAQNAQCQW